MSGTKTRGSKRVSASAATTLGAGVGGGVGTASGTALVASTGTTSAPVAVAPRPIHNQITSSAAKSVPAFLNKLYNMVSDPSSDLIHWTDDGQAFVVEKHEEFSQRVLPRFFKHNNFSSFVRQLNMYGFHKVPHLQAGALLVEDEIAEYWEFANPHFQRNQPDLLSLVTRKKGAHDTKSATAPSAVEKCEDVPFANGPAAGSNASTALVDVNAIVNEISAIKRHQLTISTDLKTIQRENQALWNESMVLREQYRRQQDTIDKIVKFLATVFEARKSTGPASVASLGGGGLSVSGGVGHGASGGAAGGIGVAGGGGMAGLNGAHGMGAGLGSGVGGAANPDALLDGMMGALGGGPASGLVGNPGSSVMEIPTKKRKLLTSGVLNAGSLSSLDSFEEFLDLDSLAAAPSGVHPAGFSVSAPGNSLASNRMSSIPASTLPGFESLDDRILELISTDPPSSIPSTPLASTKATFPHTTTIASIQRQLPVQHDILAPTVTSPPSAPPPLSNPMQERIQDAQWAAEQIQEDIDLLDDHLLSASALLGIEDLDMDEFFKMPSVVPALSTHSYRKDENVKLQELDGGLAEWLGKI